ncbi:uncharacterized protein LOC126889565 [Diabrotica virgifera virgifera]|uniref:CHK kinase-like domain-containing protein n=1 Tax=Diabrotica virgifera virgifera TaxID=50390 RepID=A0ABM5KUP0_DIAVI|nr:uncharacterized protein LOC126889565 [Diabrotica virgifera virgifera]
MDKWLSSVKRPCAQSNVPPSSSQELNCAVIQDDVKNSLPSSSTSEPDCADKDRSNPQHVALIDFQVTCLHSPILDISAFLYLNLSSEDFPNFKEFLEFYHSELSSVLTDLGSDVNKLFPKHVMQEHLKKFLHYGFCLTVAFLEIFYVDNEDVPPLIDEETNEIMGGLKDLKLKSRDEYVRRLVSIVDSFFNSGYV